jgi:hypothetical protein
LTAATTATTGVKTLTGIVIIPIASATTITYLHKISSKYKLK